MADAGMLVVFALVGVTLVLFVAEWLPPDMVAVGVLVSLVVLEPYTGVSWEAAIAGFASPATLTIVAMYMLSEGVRRTGVVDRVGDALAAAAHGSERRLLALTVGTTGVSAGLVNNTPVVAVFIPMVTRLAERLRVSPSKLLLPLSYAAMLGGTLTLVGTATNILASDLSRDLLGRPIGMFEFTPVGLLVLGTGTAYLLTVGRRLTPARVAPAKDLAAAFALEDHLARLVVRESSPLVGVPVDEVATREEEHDVDLLVLERGGESVRATRSDRPVEAGDVLTVRGSRQAVTAFADARGCRHLHREAVSEDELDEAPTGEVVEVVLPPESGLVGTTPGEASLLERFDTTVVAMRRGDSLRREGLRDSTMSAGDTLLLYTRQGALDHLVEAGDVVVTHRVDEDEEAALAPPEPSEPSPLDPKTPLAVGILLGAVGVAALDLLPIVISALGGVVAMVATGCLRPSDAYDAVSWNVVFLLAGVLPLRVALEATGGAAYVGSLVGDAAMALPAVAVLALFYLLTGLLASVVTPVAAVVLLVPIAVDTAARIDAAGFPFLLAVAYAASSAFITPVGYQTNLMVYGPGGYRFTDYLRVGAPLQLLLTVVVTGGIAVLFPP